MTRIRACRATSARGFARRGFVLVAVLVVVMLASMVAVSLMFRLKAESTAATATLHSEPMGRVLLARTAVHLGPADSAGNARLRASRARDMLAGCRKQGSPPTIAATTTAPPTAAPRDVASRSPSPSLRRISSPR
jgi:hypothetical protein